MTATAPKLPKADLSRAGLLNRLSSRIHEMEMDRLNGQVSAEEYEAVRENLDRQVRAIEALAA